MTEREWQQLNDRLNRIELKVDRLTTILEGNGRAGLVVEVDRHRRAIGTLNRVIWLTIGAAVSGAIVKFINFMQGV